MNSLDSAPTYAGDVNERLIGSAIGGVLVDPAHNLHYGVPLILSQ